MKKSPAAEIIAEALKRFPKSGKKTIALAIYKENPEVWPNEMAAHNAVRYYTGTLGSANRKKKRPLPDRPTESPGDGVARRFPNGLRHHASFEPLRVKGIRRALLLYDVHVPYHDESVLEIAVNHGIESGCDCVILAGDFMDFYAGSDWVTDPRKRDFRGELDMGREILAAIRKAFPRAQIIYKLGNHEERWERYLVTKAPILLGVEDFELEKILRLDKLNIRVMSHRAPVVLGNKLNVIHGHEFGKTMTNPVNPSRGLFLRGKANAICGHYHQTSQHTEKNIEQKYLSCWSSGSLCDMHPDYAPMNNWNHGFIEVDVSGDEDFTVHNYKILNGKVY